MLTGNVTAHFSWREVALCHSGEWAPVELHPNLRNLCLLLEVIRADYGNPLGLTVISGWRSVAYNARVGGVPHSQHLLGQAADIAPVQADDLLDVTYMIVAKLRESDPRYSTLGGFGVYPRWVHVDIRPRTDGHVARWGGDGIGSEP